MSTHARMLITISQYFKTHHIIIIWSINWDAHLRNFCLYSLGNPHVNYWEFFLSFFPQQEPSREFLRIFVFFPRVLTGLRQHATHARKSQPGPIVPTPKRSGAHAGASQAHSSATNRACTDGGWGRLGASKTTRKYTLPTVKKFTVLKKLWKVYVMCWTSFFLFFSQKKF
jgi:hypothetical protein